MRVEVLGRVLLLLYLVGYPRTRKLVDFISCHLT
jgi:hypothetical protein